MSQLLLRPRCQLKLLYKTRAASSSSTASASYVLSSDRLSSLSGIHSPPSTSSHASNNDKSGSSSRIGAALGGTLGGVAFVAIAALLFLYLRRRHSESDHRPRQRDRRSSPDPEEEFDDPPVHERDYDPFRASQLQPLHNEDDEWSPTAPTGLHTARHFPAVVGQKSPSAMDDLTHAQKDMVHMMFERGAASAAVEEVVARMRAENRGEADAPPQYDFEDSKGQRIMAASP